MERLTDKKYWNNQYGEVSEFSFGIEGHANHNNAIIYNSIKSAGLDGKSILEIGAGGSQWLIFLAKHHPTSKFTGLDFAEDGCKKLSEEAANAAADVDVICADLFSPPSECFGKFDLVISFGVVEHFDSLDSVLSEMSKYLKEDGTLWTIIPNMSGVLGFLTKHLDRDIYNLHNPHDLKSFRAGHDKAKLPITSSNYLCTTGFGVLSSCINEKTSRANYLMYLWLTRLTKAISIFEQKLFKLPALKITSAYIVCVSKKFRTPGNQAPGHQ